jgi:hypothetical protein
VAEFGNATLNSFPSNFICSGTPVVTNVNSSCSEEALYTNGPKVYQDTKCYYGTNILNDNTTYAVPTAAPTVGITDGYFYVQFYDSPTCSSDITFSQGYELNTCLVAYNKAGTAVASAIANCSSKCPSKCTTTLLNPLLCPYVCIILMTERLPSVWHLCIYLFIYLYNIL